MYSEGAINFLYRITLWIMRLAYTNILWILFSTAGLFIFGIFPATVALYTVIRQWVIKNNDLPIWKTFHKAYLGSFIKSNIVGYILLIIGTILFVNMTFLKNQEGDLYLMLYYLFLTFLFVYMIVGLFLFAIYVHYELKFFQYFKQTLYIVILHPFEVLLSIIGFIIFYHIVFFVPIIFVFFGMSAMACFTIWISGLIFKKVNIKIEKQLNNK